MERSSAGSDATLKEQPGSVHVLLVDDEPVVLRLLERFVSRDGYEVQTASDGCDALEVLNRWRADVVITDLRMPRMDGIALTEAVRTRYGPRAPLIIVHASFIGDDVRQRLQHLDVHAILEKTPTSFRELVPCIEDAIPRSR